MITLHVGCRVEAEYLRADVGLGRTRSEITGGLPTPFIDLEEEEELYLESLGIERIEATPQSDCTNVRSLEPR